ncbi:MAG: adenosine deaminase [Lachnospiraceae bacterium]|nr:adenosine deaminase [Lachnospiraceae bacterium]
MHSYLDLHLHLDGALTPAMAKELAALQNITLPVSNDESLKKLLTVSPDCESLNSFLECFALPLLLMQTPAGLRETVRLVGDHLLSQGLIYAEIRFAPQLHTALDMTQEDAVKAALKGLEETALKANLILCCMRGQGNEKANEETLELTRRYLVPDGGVVAMDLAGAEGLFPTSRYGNLFEKARAYGIPYTIHAGEADGAQSVRAAVEYGAARIGHGVRSREDPEVMEMLKEKGITLELCPTSNRMTHAVEDMTDYPLLRYMDEGIPVTVNTDDPGIEDTTIEKEFHYMRELLGLTPEQERQLLLNAVDAAFTTDEVKDSLRRQLS